MYPNESKIPLTTSLAVNVSRLGPSWRFYAKLIGLEVVGSMGRPVHSLFLAMPDSSDQEIQLRDGSEAEGFILRLTTQPLERSVERIRIELESVDELVRIWMLANMMRFPNSGLRVKGDKYSLIVRDPDWHAIELCAADAVRSTSSGDAPGAQINSPEQAAIQSTFDDHALNGVLGGLFRSRSGFTDATAAKGSANCFSRITGSADAQWD
ncbi:MAG: VOC family protein [Pyrinomonadaceae bacterium]|nr:VOC family protein [Phycisphaerales bacterium]